MKPPARNLKRQGGAACDIYSLMAIWSLTIVGLFAWGAMEIQHATRDLAVNVAQAYLDKDAAFRAWGASRGGVYVVGNEPASSPTAIKPDPGQDMQTMAGRPLILLTPSDMVNQFQDESSNLHGINHRVVTKRFGSDALPDTWEQIALKKFEKGATEVREFTEMHGEPYLRVMRPLRATRAGADASADRGSAESQIKGGLGLALPVKQFAQEERRRLMTLAGSLGILLAIGLIAIVLGARRLHRSESERRRTADELQQLRGDLEIRVQQRTADLLQVTEELMAEIAEREAAQAYLEMSETKYRAVFNNAAIGIDMVNEQGRFVETNAALQGMLGYGREELEKLTNTDVTHPEDMQLSKDKLQSLIRGDISAYSLEKRYVRKDGSPLWAHLCVSCVRDARGQHEATIGVIADITDRKTAESRLKENVRFLETLINTIPSPIFWKDVNGIYLGCNEAFAESVGLTKADIIGKSAHDVVSKEFAEKYQDQDRKMFADPGTHVFQESLGDGRGELRKVVVHKATFCDVHGSVAGLIGVVLDITELKRKEDGLRRANEMQQKLLSTAATGIFVIDQSGILTDVNDEFCLITGYSREELVGKPCMLDCRQSCSDKCTILDMKPSERIVRKQCRAKTKDGRYLTVLKNVSLLTDHAGKPTGAIESFVDVTDLIEARKSAEEASRAKSEFLANMSHEIRTPMNGVIGMTELALNTELSAEQREYLDAVKVSADSLLRLINDILDLSKMEAGKLDLFLTEFSLRDCVSDTMASFAAHSHAKGLELAYHIGSSVPDGVVGDPGRVRQILVNLVGNAVKFTETGEVVVAAELEGETEEDAMVHFSVADTGPGIDEDKRDRIFNAFEQGDASTTKRYSGTGLGLAISSRLVDAMGGRIWLESATGLGSVFHFTIRLGLQSGDARPVIPRVPANLDGLKAIVVDDNATNRRILQDMLGNWSIRATIVESGPTALDAMAVAAASGEPYDLAVIDFFMPQMDGFTLAERIKANKDLQSTTIIMLTSVGQRGDGGRCADMGIAAYLRKPVKQSELFDAISYVMAHQPTGRTSPALVTRHSLRTSKRRMSILLAEDNPVNRKLAAKMLEKMGHAVRMAGNGKEAVEAIREEIFDAVFMDVQMPEMDGFEATRAIREMEKTEGNHVPVIAMTAHAMKGDRERCLEAGMDSYISKPINSSELFEIVENLAETKPQGRSPAKGFDRAGSVPGGLSSLMH